MCRRSTIDSFLPYRSQPSGPGVLPCVGFDLLSVSLNHMKSHSTDTDSKTLLSVRTCRDNAQYNRLEFKDGYVLIAMEDT